MIEEFSYPKLGPGQLWEVAANDFEKMGGKIIKNAKVIKFKTNKNKFKEVIFIKDGKIFYELYKGNDTRKTFFNKN